MDKNLSATSKFLSLVLRHRPDQIGLRLDPQGWASVDELLQKCRSAGVPLTLELLQEVVTQNDKQRFRFSEDGTKICANQGHSIEVDLALPRREPPQRLFHGTATRFLDSIRHQGLQRRDRHHVHLSATRETAAQVGRRHGRLVILEVEAGRMWQADLPFFLSANGVWLTLSVPPEYIRFPS